MLSFSWDAAYEALPTTGLSRSSLDDALRYMLVGVRQRMGAEHNFGPFTDEDDGTHIPGKTTVLLTGNAAALAALTNMQEGSLFLQDDGTNLELFLYTSAAWLSITDDVHGSMANLTDDLCHEDYMLKDTAYVLEATFDMNDQRLSTLVAAGVPLVADHPYDNDPHSIAASSAMVTDTLSFGEAWHNSYKYILIGQVAKGGSPNTVIIELPTNARAIIRLRLEAQQGADDWQLGCIPSAGVPHIALRDNSVFSSQCDFRLDVVTTS